MTGSFSGVWPVMAGSWPRVLAEIAGSLRYASTSLVILSAKRVERSFKVPKPKVFSMMASIDEDMEKSALTDQDDVGSGGSNSEQNKNSQVEAKLLIHARKLSQKKYNLLDMLLPHILRQLGCSR